MVERPAGGKDDFSGDNESLSHRVAAICDSSVSGVTRRSSLFGIFHQHQIDCMYFTFPFTIHCTLYL